MTVQLLLLKNVRNIKNWLKRMGDDDNDDDVMTSLLLLLLNLSNFYSVRLYSRCLGRK